MWNRRGRWHNRRSRSRGLRPLERVVISPVVIVDIRVGDGTFQMVSMRTIEVLQLVEIGPPLQECIQWWCEISCLNLLQILKGAKQECNGTINEWSSEILGRH